MKHLAGLAAVVSLLITAVSHADQDAWTPLMVKHAGLQSSPKLANVDFGRPDATLRVSGSNDIYRAKISELADAASAVSARDPIRVFGPAGYYLYDLDAWAMVVTGRVIGPYRSRAYSLFGAGFDAAPLNRWIMRSELLRANANSGTDLLASWLHPAWRF
jgi:hypothetical protein